MAILSNESANFEFANRTKMALDGYLHYSPVNITGEISAQGSNNHEVVNGAIKSGISAWSNLITSDSNAIMSAHTAIASIDENLKAKMMGVG